MKKQILFLAVLALCVGAVQAQVSVEEDGAVKIGIPTGVQKGTITIAGHSLTPGLYTYSLIVDGRVLDSKRMVVIE